eukprot:3104892-Pleurochrysis_carterae.AAC.1
MAAAGSRQPRCGRCAERKYFAAVDFNVERHRLHRDRAGLLWAYPSFCVTMRLMFYQRLARRRVPRS